MSLRWKPALWEATVDEGNAVWVEQTYSSGQRWEWNCSCGSGGRAASRREALYHAQRHADLMHTYNVTKRAAPAKGARR